MKILVSILGLAMGLGMAGCATQKGLTEAEYEVYSTLFSSWRSSYPPRDEAMKTDSPFAKWDIFVRVAPQTFSSIGEKEALGLGPVNQIQLLSFADKIQSSTYSTYLHKADNQFVDSGRIKACGRIKVNTSTQPIPNNINAVVTLSRVGFNKDHTQAILYWTFIEGPCIGHGRWFLFERQNNKWVVVADSRTWIS